jgi:hypothetical protein
MQLVRNQVSWPHWTYSPDFIQEISRREKTSLVDIKSVDGVIQADETVPEPRIIILAMCEDLDIMDPFTGITIHKKDFGMIIVIVDIIVILALIIFTWALEIGQENYVKMYLDHTIEMTNFTIRIKNLPDEKFYCHDPEGGEPLETLTNHKEFRDNMLKGLLIDHFQ